jgi:serine/threonine protein kinase
LTDGRLERVEALFHEARALPADERARHLERACAGDDDLRAEVEQLLANHERDGVLLDTPALARGHRLDAEVGEVMAAPASSVGGFTLRARLGEGSMGTVFLAEQDHPKRRVAVKVLRAGPTSNEAVRRFRHEAEALGRLQHPGIAQVLESGVDGDVPYLALEYVEGLPLVEHANREGLDLRARLVLFLKVCDAVRHAHSKGVIHRDLKPANILVERLADGPQPKVLDFGIARITAEDASLTAGQTTAGEILGTLQYMSPEQASGDPAAVDARTDVYALGVLLYELLSGALPYDLTGLGVPQATRALIEHEPRSLADAAPALRGDLATLVDTALEHDVERRYATASELGAEVRRYLDDQPILAHPPSATYQLTKFARRNSALVAGAVAVVVALTGGLATTLWQKAEADEQRAAAERRFDDLHELSETFLLPFDERLRHVAGTIEARRFLVDTWLEYLDRLARQDDTPEIQRGRASAYSKIGDIQGSASESSLGDLPGALASYTKAMEVLDGLARARPGDVAVLADRVRLELRLADTHGAERNTAGAREHYERALELSREWIALAPGDDVALREHLTVSERFAGSLLGEGQVDRAHELYDEILAATRELAARRPEFRRDLGVTHSKLGHLLEGQGDAEGALEAFSAFLGIAFETLAATPHDGIAQRDALAASDRVGTLLHARGESAAARAVFARGLELAERVRAAVGRDATLLFDLAALYNRAGEFELAEGQLAEAQVIFAEYLAVAEALVELRGNDARFLRRYGVALYKMGELNEARAADLEGSPDERAVALTEAREWFEQCRAAFLDMRATGRLSASDAGVPEEVGADIERCERQLTALGGEGGRPP